MPKLKPPAMWIRIAALIVSMLVMKRAESSVLKELSSTETDDLLQRLSSDREMPRWARLLAKAPWLYRQAPIDLVPDAIPLIGRFDDRVLTSFCLSLIARLSPRQIFERNVDAVKPPPPPPESQPKRRRRRWPFSH
jgi:uncharacterized membrane protein YkvA (DUF1232 family)